MKAEKRKEGRAIRRRQRRLRREQEASWAPLIASMERAAVNFRKLAEAFFATLGRWSESLNANTYQNFGTRRDADRKETDHGGDRPFRCDYCGDVLPSVKRREHIPTTPNLQRLGFAKEKIVCSECVEKALANRPIPHEEEMR